VWRKVMKVNLTLSKYDGNAEKVLNTPITIDGKVVGIIIKIANETEENIEAEGILYEVGIDFIKDKAKHDFSFGIN